jgi:hypothetical protein
MFQAVDHLILTLSLKADSDTSELFEWLADHNIRVVRQNRQSVSIIIRLEDFHLREVIIIGSCNMLQKGSPK